MNKNRVKGLLSVGCLLILIFDSKTAVSGALSGIEMCSRVVIPSLFPFIVLSFVLTKTLYGSNIIGITLLARVFHLPKEAGVLLISSFLGGYPVGAQCVGNYYSEGFLSKKDAEKLLSFCNNAGPAFIFGMIGGLFGEKLIPWIIWAIHILSAFLVSELFLCDFNIRKKEKAEEVSMVQAVSSSILAMGQICAWVILFRILITILSQWILWMLPEYLRILISGILELTNGCIDLNSVQNMKIRFIISSTLVSFGGLCVAVQTNAVTRGLDHKKYYLGKALQAFISAVLSTTFIYQKWGVLIVAIALFYLFPNILRKKLEFSEKLMYNICIDSGRKQECSFVKK